MSERTGRGVAGTGAHRAHAVHPGLAAKHGATPPRAHRAEQGKGEEPNALARAIFFYRLGEIRDRSFEQQRYRIIDPVRKYCEFRHSGLDPESSPNHDALRTPLV